MKRILSLLFSLVLFFGCEQPEYGFVVPVPDPSDKVEDEDGPEQETPENPTPVPVGNNIIVGYATYWESRLPDPTLLTHINYAFALIKDDFETLDVKKPSRLQQVVSLKKQNPDLKVVLSVGGWGAGNSY